MARPLDPRQIEQVGGEIQAWLVQWLIERAGVLPEQIDVDRPYADYGLDSVTAVELSHDIENALAVRLAPTVAWNYPTLSTMANYLASVVGGAPVHPTSLGGTAGRERGDWEHLLLEIEQLSDEEAEAAVGHRGNGP